MFLTYYPSLWIPSPEQEPYTHFPVMEWPNFVAYRNIIMFLGIIMCLDIRVWPPRERELSGSISKAS